MWYACVYTNKKKKRRREMPAYCRQLLGGVVLDECSVGVDVQFASCLVVYPCCCRLYDGLSYFHQAVVTALLWF